MTASFLPQQVRQRQAIHNKEAALRKCKAASLYSRIPFGQSQVYQEVDHLQIENTSDLESRDNLILFKAQIRCHVRSRSQANHLRRKTTSWARSLSQFL